MRLFHLSDRPGIDLFRPRPSDYTAHPVVWAIAEDRITNYLLPRDCPRICYRAGPNSRLEDIERFLGADRAVIAIEARWAEQVRTTSLFCYAMPPERFMLKDHGAGYWISETAVAPLSCTRLNNLPAAIAARGAALHYLDSLWPLRDAVATSSLVFSLIRMRNAAAR
jgi:hypothetical protein